MASTQSSALASALFSNSDTTATARTFSEPITTAINSGASSEVLEEKLSSSWHVLIDTAAQTDHRSQESLTDIVKAIQQQRASDDEKSKSVTIWGSEAKVWEDMPLLGASMRSAWNRAPNSGSKDDFSTSEWTNLNAFVARLTALSLSLSIPAFDFSLYAIWTLRSAYEKSETDAAAVEAAKIWFVYAEEAMEKLSHDEKSFEGPIAKAGEKYADREWKGFNEKRLAVWRAG
ncbi:hypothetical protein IFR04_000691 [Cadophora malorum]|uniref:Uncharacterized protein n=1 Tax=Cadophora malorum TaxID=108018 RepID=A0A8H7WJV4_9HELO|nr:hypothetical protein IFR04_000691 [Cadophora malorum]